jgi:GNAT superfamily N-acetyltransferase
MVERGNLASLRLMPLPDADLGEALSLVEEYVGSDRNAVRAWRDLRPRWCVAAYVGAELVGVCYGNESSPGHVVLQGIAVRSEWWRGGIGSRILREFESVVAEDGMTQVSLGSASDRPTESFYLNNGYRAVCLVLKVTRSEVRRDEDVALPRPTAEIEQGDEIRCEFAMDSYNPALRDRLVSAHSAANGMFIFEKAVGHKRAAV